MADAAEGTPGERAGQVLLLLAAAVATAWPMLLAPSLPFEDGTLLFARSYAEFRLTDWFEVYAGYLAFVPNVAASVLCRLPAPWIPMAFVIATVVLRVAAAAELLRPRWRAMGPPSRRTALALGFVALPYGDHLLAGSLAYSQWCLLGWLALRVTAPATADERPSWSGVSGIALLAWSNPLSLLLVPIALAGPQTVRRARAVPLLGAVAIYWAYLWAAGATAIPGAGPGSPMRLWRWLCLDVAFDTLVGEGVHRAAGEHLERIAMAVGAAAWGLAIAWLVRRWRRLDGDRRRFAAGMLWLAVSTTVTAWASRGALSSIKVVRYAWLAQLGFASAAGGMSAGLAAVGRHRRWRTVLLCAWVICLWANSYHRYRVPPAIDPQPFLQRLVQQEEQRGGRRWVVARLVRPDFPIVVMPR